jgi:NADPH2:quinone reductase
VSFELAAAAMLQGMTAHYLSHDCYRLRPTEIALVHAGAGGVGQLLIQMTKQLGATVIATVSTEAKAAIAKACGAGHVIRYTTQDFEAETMRITEGKGVHVVYDSVGKDTFAKGMKVLRNRGYMVCYGQSSGWPDPVALQTLNINGTFVTRPSLVHYTQDRQEIALRSGAVFQGLAAGRLKIDITETFPLKDAAEAHRRLEGRATTGKLLLIP